MSMAGILSMAALGLAVGLAIYLLVDVRLPEQSEHGPRGVARHKAMISPVFRALDPILQILAAHVSAFRLDKLRNKLEEALVAAGEFHGMGPNEVIALSALSALFGLATAYYFWAVTAAILVPLLCLLLAPFLPTMQLRSLAQARCRSVDRGLPIAIDLAALCMGAGLDFPGAIQHVVDNMPDQESAIRQELERLTQELSLGRTRRQALESFARRVDSDSVKEFVASVVQAEEKGTPLSTVLSIQAGALRGRRSVLAEEAAARAGVMLMLPMMMMMISICLILMGPLFIDMLKGGLM